MTFKSYMESGGGICPKCGSTAIKPGYPPEKVSKNTVHVSMFCATCGARWLDKYVLSKAEDL